MLGFVVGCFSEVELGDGPLAAAVGQLVGDALAVALELGEVLVEDFARAQGRDKVVELAAFLPALLCLPCLALPLPLLLQLCATAWRERRHLTLMQVVVGVPNTHVVTPTPMKQECFPTPALSMRKLVSVIDTTPGLRSTAPWLCRWVTAAHRQHQLCCTF